MSTKRTEAGGKNTPRRTSKPEADTPAAPTAADKPMEVKGIPIQAIGAFVGAAIFVVLNVVTDDRVPGGFNAGIIGGGLGWIAGVGIEKWLARRASRS